MRRFSTIAVHILLFSLLLLYSRSYSQTYIDDAFIQFQYAKNIVRSGTWGFFEGAITNTATSPLNVLMLSAIATATRSVVEAAVWLSAGEFYLLLVFLSLISKRVFNNRYFGIVAFVGLITNPLLLSTLGMESWLFILLLVSSLYFLLQEKWYWLAVSLALLTLARHDGFLMFVVAFFMAPTNKKIQISTLYVLMLIPWHVFSWIYLGSVVPETLILKTMQRSWHGNTFSNGLDFYYFPRYPLATFLSFFLLPLGLLSHYSKKMEVRRLIVATGCVMLLHFACYTMLGVPPYHWYYVSLAAGSVLLGSLGVSSVLERCQNSKVSWIVSGTGLFLPVLGFLILATNEGFPFTEAPIHTNWATHEQYKTAGLWLRENTDPDARFVFVGEIGTLAYYSDRKLMNQFSSPGAPMALLRKSRQDQGRIKKMLLGWNFRWRRRYPAAEPPSYILTHSLNNESQKSLKGALMTWNTSSKWISRGTLILRRTRKSLNRSGG